jgi:hypothetical protein
MELINETSLIAGYNVGLEPGGRELLVVVVKGTFTLPRAGDAPALNDKQVALVMADVFRGEPGKTAPVFEADFAPRKQRCDVLLIGSAHAPGGQAVRRMRVRMKVGSIEKAADVVGDRVWRVGLAGITASSPEPFESMPLTYDRAFGGTDDVATHDEQHEAYFANPVGRGWRKNLGTSQVEGTPLPNLEVPGRDLRLPTDEYTPIAFGPVGRGWSHRIQYAGTYDQQWVDNVFPFLPDDFDERYHQAAPEDQQMSIPTGPVNVELNGVTSDGFRAFTLRYVKAPVTVFPKRGTREAWNALLDTIVLEPDAERLTLTWRVTRPLQKSIFEISRVQIGSIGHEAWDAPAPANSPSNIG